MANGEIFLDNLTEFDTRHIRHEHVTDDDIRHFIAYNFESFLSIYGRKYAIVRTENRHQQLSDVVIVFHNQYRCLFNSFHFADRRHGISFQDDVRLRLNRFIFNGFLCLLVFFLHFDFVLLEVVFAQRKRHDKGCSLIDYGVYANGSVMLLHDVLGQIKANARAHFGQRLEIPSLIEAVEHVGKVGFCYAFASVGDAKNDLPTVTFGRHIDVSTLWSVLQCVRNEVVDHLSHLPFVNPNLCICALIHV